MAWHDKLFRCIGATILSELIDLEKSVLVWDPHAMMVLVACYLHRVLGPLAAYLKQLIENARQQGLLQHTVEANVQICMIDALTGPTAEVVHIVRHRRVTAEADQHKGNQSDRIPTDSTLASPAAESPPPCGWRMSHSVCPGSERLGCTGAFMPTTRGSNNFSTICSTP